MPRTKTRVSSSPLEEDPFGDELFDRTLADETEEDFEVSLSRVIPEGPQPFICREVEKSSVPGPSGYHYARVTWECVGEEGRGLNLFDNLSHSPDALFRWHALFNALGLSQRGVFKPYRELAGKTIWIDVVHETFEGNTRPKANAYVSGPPIEVPAEATPEPVKANLGREFA